jgi:nucleoprotein TPR
LRSQNSKLTFFSNRCKDLSSQNNVLHQHLESVSTQAARIRQAASSSSEAQATETEGSEDSDAKLAELRSVVSWLRREKGIVELQLQLASDENARFKRQIEHLSKSLQETQSMLSEVSDSIYPNFFPLSTDEIKYRNAKKLLRMLLLLLNTLNLSRELHSSTF